MDNLIPNSYTNFAASICLVVSIACLLATYRNGLRSHSTKLFAIMLVASISIFSSHWATYFAAIFIIATAVTELEFLQNLAAIIRKDKNYFDYKKEAITKNEAIRKKAEEEIEDEYVSSKIDVKSEISSTSKIDLKLLDSLSGSYKMRLAFDVEERALSKLSEKYGRIDRFVRFKKSDENVEFDGVISRDREGKDILFEIKWARGMDHIFSLVSFSLRKFSDQIHKHREITGLSSEGHLVVVINSRDAIPAQKIEKFKRLSDKYKVTIEYLTLEDLGYELVE